MKTKRPLFSIYRICVVLILSLKCLKIGIFVNCEMFKAQVELDSLFNLRKTVSDGINKYLEKEELRLHLVRNILLKSSALSPMDYTTNSNRKADPRNPINAFIVIKGLSKDLSQVLLPALDSSNINELSDLLSNLNKTNRFPDHHDLKGAADGLTRLQETYNLSTKSLSKGCLLENICSTELTLDDCFELGRQNFESGSYNHSIAWMNEALAKLELLGSFNQSKSSHIFGRGHPTKSEILESISLAEQVQRFLNIGKELSSRMTETALDSLVDEVVDVIEGEIESEGQTAYTATIVTYKALCRGEDRDFSSINPDLKCSYSSREHPFYIIGPIMQELISLEPMIWKFHKVLYDPEIKIVKELAKKYLKPATVFNNAGIEEPSPIRVSKSAWLFESDDPVLEKVNIRVGLLTGLNMKAAEALQIANYGLGGMYLPHYDFKHVKHTNPFDEFVDNKEEDRIATLMFYMSNVEGGGATVFPSAKLSVWPEKGSAVFWYNFKRDGSGDLRTRHAACPVLVGSKWVSNKWIHDRGQEFTRPCNLHEN